MKIFLLVMFCLSFVFQANAQTADLVLEKGVAAHKGIDEVYRQFSEAYRNLNAEQVINLYTESAAYLPPNDNILLGRDKVRTQFAPFFDSVKRDGRTMTISFQVFQRRVEGNMGYDVGIYTLRFFKDGKEIGAPGKGKFFVVAVKDKDDKWRFQVDGYNDLPRPKTAPNSNQQ
jgi:ketosteroid isomerase-like protein